MLYEIERIAREAGEVALRHQGSLAALEVAAKGHLDLVTAADQAVEQLIEARLRETFPDDGIHGEEGTAVPSRTGRVWVVDPIDGTFNFVRGGDQWAVSIGLYQGGRPRLGVIHASAGAVRQLRTGLTKGRIIVPHAAQRSRHSARAAARFCLKSAREEWLRSMLKWLVTEA